LKIIDVFRNIFEINYDVLRRGNWIGVGNEDTEVQKTLPLRGVS